MQKAKLDEMALQALRVHSIEMVQKANSGHPGMALGAAPMIWTLYNDTMKHNPDKPDWIDRDRFILSAGHASALLYSLLNLFQYDLSDDDMAKFRQLNSKTPGHPEIVLTPGVDAGTGPLGQGVAMAVGMAVAEAHLAAVFNTEEHKVIDHYTYVLHGDGCPQEGVAHEAISFAGTQKLDKLIMIYDRNQVTIDGDINITFTEDVAKRYEACAWQVLQVADANNLEALREAIKTAKAEKEKPSLIIVESAIGFGSPLQGSNKTHGSPLGEENVNLTKGKLGWSQDIPQLSTPSELKTAMSEKKAELISQYDSWQKTFADWQKSNPELANKWVEYFNPDYSKLSKDSVLCQLQNEAEASRASSSKVLNRLADLLPNLIGGSADLAGSNKSWMNDKGTFSPSNRAGRNIHFGIREFAMSCIANGIALHGGLLPYCATFFTFSDYMRSGIRSATLMKLPTLFVFTHDSIGVGEDGPTHQPVEHLASFRAMPEVLTFRPADYIETAAAYTYAIQSGRPTVFAFSRQGLEQLDLPAEKRAVDKGAYIVKDSVAEPQIIFLSSGSELTLCLSAQAKLAEKGIASRVISVPSMELFLEQDASYQESLLPANIEKRFAVEAAATLPWYRFVGLKGKVLGIDKFGASAKAGDLFARYGITAEQVLAEAEKYLVE